jgi:hypothetical protein
LMTTVQGVVESASHRFRPQTWIPSYNRLGKAERDQEGRNVNKHNAFVTNTVVMFYSYLERAMALGRTVDGSEIPV